MGSDANHPPLIVIVGQTASGKSAMALELAQQFNGEIICADSRTVYRGMDIGTAKPSKKDQQLIPHHLLDIAEPDKPITAAIFQQEARRAIDYISSRSKQPFLVGGTGLYVDAVLYDFSFLPKPSSHLREQLNSKTVEELQEILRANQSSLPKNARNPRHLIRKIETGNAVRKKSPLRQNTLILGLEFLDTTELKERLAVRLEQMFADGLEDEVRELVATFGWDCASLNTIGYKEFKSYFAGDTNLPTLKASIVRHSLQYAKRQKTWFKANHDIQWICKKEEAVELITSWLNKNYIG